MVPGEMVCRPRIPRVTRFPRSRRQEEGKESSKCTEGFELLSLSLFRVWARARAHFANNLADFGLRFCFILHLRLVCSLLQVNFAFISLHLLLYHPCFMVLGTVSWGLHAALGNSRGCCSGLFSSPPPLAAHNFIYFS